MENTYEKQITEIIETLELNNETERSILKSRFLGEVLQYESRKNNTKKYYNIFRFLVTSGSILLPAVLSMGQMDPAKLPKNFDNISYWTSWTISLMVTACNGFLQLFSLDKNYFEYAITSEQLKTEGWQFFQLSGKYEDFSNHIEAYRPFCKSIENIKRKQVEKEFSGKGEVKKKKEFDFDKELEKQLEKTEKIKKLREEKLIPDKDNNLNKDAVLSMLSKIAPDKVQAVAAGINNSTDRMKESIQESIQGPIGSLQSSLQGLGSLQGQSSLKTSPGSLQGQSSLQTTEHPQEGTPNIP